MCPSCMHGLTFLHFAHHLFDKKKKKSLLKKEASYVNMGLNSKILGQVQGPRSPPPYEGI